MRYLKIKLFGLAVSAFTLSYAQVPENVNIIDAQPNTITSFTGNMSSGEIMEDLS